MEGARRLGLGGSEEWKGAIQLEPSSHSSGLILPSSAFHSKAKDAGIGVHGSWSAVTQGNWRPPRGSADTDPPLPPDLVSEGEYPSRVRSRLASRATASVSASTHTSGLSPFPREETSPCRLSLTPLGGTLGQTTAARFPTFWASSAPRIRNAAL